MAQLGGRDNTSRFRGTEVGPQAGGEQRGGMDNKGKGGHRSVVDGSTGRHTDGRVGPRLRLRTPSNVRPDWLDLTVHRGILRQFVVSRR
jgi:hypothetical protein